MVKVGAPRQAAVQESFIEKLLQRAQLGWRGWPLGANFGDGLVTSVRSLWENSWKTNLPLACSDGFFVAPIWLYHIKYVFLSGLPSPFVEGLLLTLKWGWGPNPDKLGPLRKIGSYFCSYVSFFRRFSRMFRK